MSYRNIQPGNHTVSLTVGLDYLPQTFSHECKSLCGRDLRANTVQRGASNCVSEMIMVNHIFNTYTLFENNHQCDYSCMHGMINDPNKICYAFGLTHCGLLTSLVVVANFITNRQIQL